jgi:preprotein translocase subunit SecF
MIIIAKRKLWYSLSITVLLPLVIFLFIFGLRLGIDFTGGAILEIKGNFSNEQINDIAKAQGVQNVGITPAENNRILIRYSISDQSGTQIRAIEDALRAQGAEILRTDQIGPSVSRDLAKNAVLSVAVMSLAVVSYVSYAFRKTSRVIRPYQFGLATVIAAFLHDALFVIGVFSVLGKVMNVEVDSFIITAILTVIGFSIHDTIVVFDRIREKLNVEVSNFSETVEDSLQETLVRSLNTSFVIILVLLALLLFGGESTRYFIFALLLGMVAGTYSSIFIASPLLVSWNLHKKKKVEKFKPSVSRLTKSSNKKKSKKK